MTITLFAQPYDITATGFYFETVEQYDERAGKTVNDYGEPVEEFEIQFIDGERLDCELAKAIGLNQANFRSYLECVDVWEDWEKINVIIAVGECGEVFDPDVDPDHLCVEVQGVESLRDLAEDFAAQGVFGDIPEGISHYIDYDAIARDLACDYCETEIAGERHVYAYR